MVCLCYIVFNIQRGWLTPLFNEACRPQGQMMDHGRQ